MTTDTSTNQVQQVLAERARALARVPDEDLVEEELFRLVTFAIGDERYGVEAAYVQEAHPLREGSWSRVPCAPDFIVGLANLRGRLYSITDVGRFFGLPARPLSDRAHLLLVRAADSRRELAMELCLLADDMPETRLLPLSELHPPRETMTGNAQDYARGVTDDMLIVLDLRKLLLDPSLLVHDDS